MSWLPVGALALQEHGPYSARDEDEMIELVDLMHSDYHLVRDRVGLPRVCFAPKGRLPTRTEMNAGHLLETNEKHAKQVEAPRPSGEWVHDRPLYMEEWEEARADRMRREAADGTNEKTQAMIDDFRRSKQRSRR